MNLLNIEIEILSMFLDKVTQEWERWKDSPDIAFYRDYNQLTSISFPDMYIDHDIPNGTLEIMKDTDQEKWKEWKVFSSKDSKEILLPALGYEYARKFPTGILDSNTPGNSCDYHYIKYHHTLDIDVLEKLSENLTIINLYYVRFGTASSFKTSRLLSSEEVMRNKWFIVYVTPIKSTGYGKSVDIYSPWYTALLLPKGQFAPVMSMIDGENWEKIKSLISRQRSEIKELLEKVITLRKNRGDKNYQFFRTWSERVVGKGALFTPYFGNDDPKIFM